MNNVRSLLVTAMIGLTLVSCTQKREDIETVAPSIIPGSAEDFARNISNTVYFGFDKYNLTPDAENVLRQVVAWLRMYNDKNVIVEGHTDKRGTKEYNVGLGSRRAESVKKFMTEQGVEPNRVATISYGKEALITDSDTEEGHALNRRSHVVISQ
ncbi:MAG: OmpA family protein [Holosporales bacterium]|jgi:peptidoglycan-associated lipoprotein|nr:OmpA family protein [Holosporales bacterium]